MKPEIELIEESLKPVRQRMAQLELLVDAIELDHRNDTSILSRKNLAKRLGCSDRFIQNNQDFKGIEHRIGSRVFYDWKEVRYLITTKNDLGESHV